MTEDRIIRSDMERLNGNQALLASSKRNEEAVMKLMGLKQKVSLFWFGSPSARTHTMWPFYRGMLRTWRTFYEFRGRRDGLAGGKTLALLRTQTHLTQKVLRYAWWGGTALGREKAFACLSCCDLLPRDPALATLGGRTVDQPDLVSSFSVVAFLWLRLLSVEMNVWRLIPVKDFLPAWSIICGVFLSTSRWKL